MTKIVRNDTLYMDLVGNEIFICEYVAPRKGARKREHWSLMHVVPVDLDQTIAARNVPWNVRQNARKHFGIPRKFVCDGNTYATLEEASAHAAHVFQKEGIVIAVTERD